MKFQNVDEGEIWVDMKFELSSIKKQFVCFLRDESRRLKWLKVIEHDKQKPDYYEVHEDTLSLRIMLE